MVASSATTHPSRLRRLWSGWSSLTEPLPSGLLPGRLLLFVLLLCGPLLAVGACRGRGKKKPARQRSCQGSRLEEDRRWLADLCAAHAQRLSTPGPHWWGLKLAQADVMPVPRLPPGVLLTLTPRKLYVDGKPAPDWPKPPTWIPPSMSLGVAPVIARMLPVLRRSLGSTAAIPSARRALEDLQGRASRIWHPAPHRSSTSPRQPRPGSSSSQAPGAVAPTRSAPKRPPDLPSGLTLLVLLTAKGQLPSGRGQGPRLAHLAIGPAVSMLQLVQLQALLALAGFDGIHLLFTPRRGAAAPSPPLPRVLRAFAPILPGAPSRVRLTARQRALQLEERRWEKAGCTDMARLRATLASTPRERLCEVLRDRLPDTIRRCDCILDERRLLTLWQAALGPMDRVGHKSIRLHPRSRPLRARATAQWATLADRVVARRGHHLWLKLSP